MLTTHVVPFLARRVRGKSAQESVLSTYPEIAEYLATNPDLDDSVWYKLTKKMKAPVVVALATGNLDSIRLAELLKEKRITVRNALFSKGLSGCTEEMADMVIKAGWMTSDQARYWLVSGSVPTSRIKQVAKVEQGSTLLHHLGNPDMFSESEAIELMSLPRMAFFRPALHRLFDMRPNLIQGAVATGTDRLHLLEAAVGSRHLYDRSVFEQILQIIEKSGRQSSASLEVLLTMLANPNTPNDIVERGLKSAPQSTSYGTWARWRPASSQHMYVKLRDLRLQRKQRGSITTSWEFVEEEDKTFVLESVKILGANRYPTITDWIRTQLGSPSSSGNNSVVQQASRQDTKTEYTTKNVVISEIGAHHKITKEIVEELQVRLDPLGVAGWSTFWSLVDTWQGTVSEIIDATVELSK